MSTVTYAEAVADLGVSLSTVQRRLRITGVPTQIVEGRAVFDLESLVDAWEQHRQIIEDEKAARQYATESSISVSIPFSQRQRLEQLRAAHGGSLAATVREVIEAGLNTTSS